VKKLKKTSLLSSLPPKILKETLFVIEFLEQNYNVHCFIVGGAVRDLLLKREVFDIDIECFGISVKSFEEAMSKLEALGVGKSFFVYKYGNIDIALPRIDNKTGLGHRGFEVKLAKEPKEASRRRDFTINSLMFDTKSKEVIDFWGGLNDLQNRILRATDYKSFVEDSLRVLRGVQFGARFGLKLEKNSCRLFRQIDLDDLPKERIFGELKKLFSAKYLHYGLFIIVQSGVDEKIFGFKISKKQFLKISKALVKYQNRVSPELYEFLFLAVLKRFIDFDMSRLLSRIGAPNLYKKKLNITYPQKIDLEFVANLAKKEPVKSSILSYDDEVSKLAKKIGVWDRAFDIGTTPTQLIKMGFKGKALGDELERLRQKRIQELKRELNSL